MRSIKVLNHITSLEANGCCRCVETLVKTFEEAAKVSDGVPDEVKFRMVQALLAVKTIA